MEFQKRRNCRKESGLLVAEKGATGKVREGEGDGLQRGREKLGGVMQQLSIMIAVGLHVCVQSPKFITQYTSGE